MKTQYITPSLRIKSIDFMPLMNVSGSAGGGHVEYGGSATSSGVTESDVREQVNPFDDIW